MFWDSSIVAAFAVSNGGGSSPTSFTSRSGWSSLVLDSAAWDGAGTDIIGASSDVSFNTAAIGLYSSIFGDNPLISIYWHDLNTGIKIDEASDEIFQFHFFPNSSSEFIALTVNGTVVDSSSEVVSAATTPEPSTFALAALGLLSLGMVRRRRRR